MNQTQPDKTVPVLAGGAFLGILSALPVLNLLNCFCCMLVLGGGGLAVFLYLRDYPSNLVPPTYGDGALLGALSGIVGAVVYTIVEIPLTFIQNRIGLGYEEEISEWLGNLSPEIGAAVESSLQDGLSPALIVLSFLICLVVFTLFAAIGGVLGIAIFKRNPPGQYPPAGHQGYQPPPPPPESAPPRSALTAADRFWARV